MSTATAAWFAIAGATAIARWAPVFTGTAYYDPVSIADHAAVLVQTATMLATGIALLLLGRRPPVPRARVLLIVAAAGAIAQSIGNLLEDAIAVEPAVWAFVVGSVVYMLSLTAAGIAALTVASPLRWSGLFLILGALGGMLGAGLLVMGVAWIAFAVWILRRREHHALPGRTPAAASRPGP